MKEIHVTAMYGDDDLPASQLFNQNEAVKYYETAQEMLLLILIIAFQFGFYYENIPEEERKYLDETAPGFFKKGRVK